MNETWKELGIMNEPWENEPDYKDFDYKGFYCEIKRIETMGHLCGYVYIPIEDHATGRMAEFVEFFSENNLDYADADCIYDKFSDRFRFRVHGGVTYSNIARKDGKIYFVIGFDCAHAGDLLPYSQRMMMQRFSQFPSFGGMQDIYRDINYVESEIKSMINQLLEEEETQ